MIPPTTVLYPFSPVNLAVVIDVATPLYSAVTRSAQSVSASAQCLVNPRQGSGVPLQYGTFGPNPSD